MKLLLNVPQDMTAEFSKVFEILEGGMNFNRVDFCVFVNEQISQPCHRHNLFGEIFRYNIMPGQDKYSLFIIMGSVPTILRNQILILPSSSNIWSLFSISFNRSNTISLLGICLTPSELIGARRAPEYIYRVCAGRQYTLLRSGPRILCVRFHFLNIKGGCRI